MGLITTLIVGGIAGWLTGMVMKSSYGLIGNIVLGIVGGIVGGFLGGLLTGVDMVNGFNITSILVSVIGAVIVVAVARMLKKS